MKSFADYDDTSYVILSSPMRYVNLTIYHKCHQCGKQLWFDEYHRPNGRNYFLCKAHCG